MALDLKNLKKTEVSRDLKGKFVLIYGAPKIGKTTLAVQFPDNLLLAVEHGYNAIDDIYAVDIPTWGEFKKYVKQLRDPDLQAQFKTITIDTAPLLYDRCTAFICDREGVDKIGDIPYGQGYGMVDKEYDDTIRSLTTLGYGLCFIGHEKVRVETDGSVSYKHIVPDMSDRCSKILNRMVDLTAYIGMEDGTRYIYPRAVTFVDGSQTTEIYAGSHFSNLNDKIELSYENLVNAIADAIEKDAADKGKKVSKSAKIQTVKEVEYDYKAIRTSIGKVGKALMKADEEAGTSTHMDEYTKIVSNYLGAGRTVKETTEQQAEVLSLILEELEEYAAKSGIKA